METCARHSAEQHCLQLHAQKIIVIVRIQVNTIEGYISMYTNNLVL